MRKSILILVPLAVAGIAAFAYGLGPARFTSAEKIDVATLRVELDTLADYSVATGTVRSQVGAEVKVGSQISGIVAELRVNIGDKVNKGDLLASLDDTEWRARVHSLEAELTAAIAETDFAQTELNRMEKMSANVSVNEIESKRKNLKVRQATVLQLKAKLAEAQIQLRYTRITAPVAGTIASVSTYEGETVAANFAAPTFVTIVDLERLEIQAYVDETDIGKVRVGQAVSFRVDAYADRELAGTVRAIYPKAQLINNVVNYVVIIDIVDKRGLLIRPEMTAHVNFILEKKADIIAVPRSALLRENGRNFVVVRDASTWTKRPVKIGLNTADKIEIVAGLNAGEVVAADTQPWKETKAQR